MTILILGAAGMIGHRLLIQAQQTFGASQVYATIRGSKSKYSQHAFLQQQVFEEIQGEDFEKIATIIQQTNPNVIINAIGITNKKSDIQNFEKAIAVNSLLPRRLAKLCESQNRWLIQLSTDCVFDGKKGQYTELDVPSAQDNYGRSKILGEVESDRCTTFRFSCIGRELAAHTELLDWFLFQKQSSVKGYSKALYSGLTNLVIAKEIVGCIRDTKLQRGLYQISGNEISKAQLLKQIAKTYKLNVEVEEFDQMVTNKSLLHTKYSELTGFKPPTWEEMIHDLHQDKMVQYPKFSEVKDV